MTDKDFVLQRIRVYAGTEVDPNSDAQVIEILQRKFNILLPQRRSLNEALAATSKTHEIIDLIKQYRE